jgi:autotransporter-associated beta strand protein
MDIRRGLNQIAKISFGSNLFFDIRKIVDWVFSSPPTYAVADLIGGYNLIKNGSGELALYGNNTYLGSTIINEGTLTVSPWTPRGPSANFRSIAMSSNGEKQIALINTGAVYISEDSGVTWTPRTAPSGGTAVAMSSDGTKITIVSQGGPIIQSMDGGITFSQTQTAFPFNSIAMSSDGTKQTAVGTNSLIYSTINNWVSYTTASVVMPWIGIAMSSDGTIRTAIFAAGAYNSIDSGVNWTQTLFASFSTVGAIAMSSDGTKQTVLASPMYFSTNSGVTWTSRNTGMANISSIAMSSDGILQTALGTGSTGGSLPSPVGSYIYTSNDSGVTWISRGYIRYWRGIAMSSDGTKQTAVSASSSGMSGVFSGEIRVFKFTENQIPNTSNVLISSGTTVNLLNDETVGSISGDGNISLNYNKLTFGINSNNTDLNGNITGINSTLIKEGTGITGISCARLLATGNVTVNNGTLKINNLTTNGGSDVARPVPQTYNLNGNGAILFLFTNVAGANRMNFRYKSINFSSNGNQTIIITGNILVNESTFTTNGGPKNYLSGSGFNSANAQSSNIYYNISDGIDDIDLEANALLNNQIINKSGLGKMSIVSQTLSISGPLTISSGTLDIGLNCSFANNFSNNVNTINNTGILSYSSNLNSICSNYTINGTGNLIKNNTSELTLNSNNCFYTGSTSILNGKLIMIKVLGIVTATAKFSNTTLEVTFSSIPNAGTVFYFFQGPTIQVYSSVILNGAGSRTASYNSSLSALTIS